MVLKAVATVEVVLSVLNIEVVIELLEVESGKLKGLVGRDGVEIEEELAEIVDVTVADMVSTVTELLVELPVAEKIELKGEAPDRLLSDMRDPVTVTVSERVSIVVEPELDVPTAEILVDKGVMLETDEVVAGLLNGEAGTVMMPVSVMVVNVVEPVSFTDDEVDATAELGLAEDMLVGEDELARCEDTLLQLVGMEVDGASEDESRVLDELSSIVSLKVLEMVTVVVLRLLEVVPVAPAIVPFETDERLLSTDDTLVTIPVLSDAELLALEPAMPEVQELWNAVPYVEIMNVGVEVERTSFVDDDVPIAPPIVVLTEADELENSPMIEDDVLAAVPGTEVPVSWLHGPHE